MEGLKEIKVITLNNGEEIKIIEYNGNFVGIQIANRSLAYITDIAFTKVLKNIMELLIIEGKIRGSEKTMKKTLKI